MTAVTYVKFLAFVLGLVSVLPRAYLQPGSVSAIHLHHFPGKKSMRNADFDVMISDKIV
jgi:hypothetical protein